jgi:hypothetical protein
VRLRSAAKAVVHSRTALVVGILISLAVPALTLPRLPHVALLPIVLGLVPYVVGKYLLCPLRWRALTNATLSRGWHIRAYAESELLGLLTPGHVGADLWRLKRLSGGGLARGDAVTSVAADRLVGAVSLVALVAVLVLRRVRPGLLPMGPMPRPRALLHGLWLSACYQLSIAGLLLGTIAATGQHISPIALLGAFGASQIAGAVPGPNGASPREGALVVALAALGVPWTAAAAAVALKATLAWLPALALGGASLYLTRRAALRPALATA